MARLTDVLALAEKANRTLAATEDLRGKPYTPPRPLVRIADQLATLQAVSEACAKVLHAPPPEVAEIKNRQAVAYLKQALAPLERWDMLPQIRKVQSSLKAAMADPSLRPPKCEARPRVRRPGRAPRRGSNTHLRGSRRVTRAGPSSDDDPGEPEPRRLGPRQHGDSRPLAEAGR